MKTEDEVIALTLLVSRERSSTSAATVAEVDTPLDCTFEAALRREARLTAQEITKVYGIDEALADFNRIETKYGAPFDDKRLSAEDRRTLDRLTPVMQTALAQKTLASDLVLVADLEQTSKLMLDARRTAAYEAPGDLENWASVWSAWVKSGKVTAAQDELTRTINLLDEKIPYDLLKDLDAQEAAGPGKER